MATIAKMLLTILTSAALTTWYLSYHPYPLSNADSVFVLVSSMLSVWVAFLIHRIDCLREDLQGAEPLKLIRKFTREFLDPETIQDVVDKKLEKRAGIVDAAVQRAIQFQTNGMGALGLAFSSDSDEERDRHFETLRKNVDSDVRSAKDAFWELYDLASGCGGEFSLKLRARSYKNYLPKR